MNRKRVYAQSDNGGPSSVWMDRWAVGNRLVPLLPALYGRLNLRSALSKVRQDIEAFLHARPLTKRFIESIGVGVGD